MNRLFVVNKPAYISSNSYLSRIKRKYKNKKAGFSGTLDPFAKGCLIVAFGQFSKLFNYIEKTPKRYRATLWLGALSDSYDIENILSVESPNSIDKINIDEIKKQIESLIGEIEYIPPKYSAKKVDGQRAYKLARSGEKVAMKKSVMNVLDTKLIHYKHPFITFEATVSEGTYIRSLAQILAQKLNHIGTLSSLERLNEGKFYFENEKILNPLDFINLPRNKFFGEEESIKDGKKISIDSFEIKEDGEYIVCFENFFSIIEINNSEISYKLNRMNYE